MDLAALIIGFISILVNLKQKDSLKEKTAELKSALNKVDGVYQILSYAKTFHDEFEKFERVGIDPLNSLLERKRKGSATDNDIQKTLEGFFTHGSDFLRSMHIEPVIVVNNRINDDRISMEISNNINIVIQKQQDLLKQIAEFDRNYKMLNEFFGNADFGIQFMKCSKLLSNTASEVRRLADDVILNSAPIMDFIHFRLKQGVEDL